MAAQLPPAAPPRHIAPSAPLRAAQTGPRKTASSADEGWRGRGRGERGVGRSAPGCSASAPRVPPVPAGLAGSSTRRLSQPRSTPRLGQPHVSGLRASGLRAARPPPPSAGPSHRLTALARPCHRRLLAPVGRVQLAGPLCRLTGRPGRPLRLSSVLSASSRQSRRRRLCLLCPAQRLLRLGV